MQKTLVLVFKAGRKAVHACLTPVYKALSFLLFYGNGVRFGSFSTSGVPYVSVARGGACRIGPGFSMHNILRGNPIGRPQRCVFAVHHDAVLTIGAEVGITGTVFNCQTAITVGDRVTIGGGTCIYDSDFHSLVAAERRRPGEHVGRKPVVIGPNAFIGAHCTILKGVTIGENAVIGACSVVTRSVPAGEIWAGNPAVFVRKLSV